MQKLLPLIAAVAVALVLIGPARQLLPSTLRFESGGTLVTSEERVVDHGRVTGIGLAPAPVVNPPATAARLTVVAEGAEKPEHGYLLTVQLSAPDGKPIADAPVKFFDIVDLFGSREMLLASSTTDGRGIASYEYLPATTGVHQIVARFSGRGAVKAGEGRMSFDATVAAPERHTERRPLASFSDRVPYAVGVLVLAVWGLIGFALFGTARGVIGGARRTRGKEEPA